MAHEHLRRLRSQELVVQSEFLRHQVNRPIQSLAEGISIVADALRNVCPGDALLPKFEQIVFFAGQAAADFLEEVF